MSSLTVSTVHHVSFRVDDLDEALAFYCGVLGCEKLQRPDLGFPGAWLKAGDTEVHIIESEPQERYGRPPHSVEYGGIANHVAFRVADLDAAIAHLKALGHPVQVGTVLRQAFVQDPSGNMLELSPAA
jgi:glyoxylase I family protein